MKSASFDRCLAPSRHSGDGPAIRVLVLCPGGLEHGGGIGRQMGYFLAALPQGPDTPAYRVIDTRGPWFLGGARWRIPLSALYFVAAAFRIAWAGIAGRPSLLHVNITGRGSTMRKLALTAIARMVALPYVLHIHDYDYAVDFRARREGCETGCVACSPLRRKSSSWGWRRSGRCGKRCRCRTRRSWFCRTRCPIRTPHRGRRDPCGSGEPGAPRVFGLSQRPQGRAGTLGGIGEPGAGGSALACDARWRRSCRRIPGSRCWPWPRRPGGVPRLDRSAGGRHPVRGRRYPGPALVRGRACHVDTGGAGARACRGGDAGRRSYRGDRAGAVRPVSAAGRCRRAGRGARPRGRRSGATRASARRRPPALPRPFRRAVLLGAPGEAACRAARRSRPPGLGSKPNPCHDGCDQRATPRQR